MSAETIREKTHRLQREKQEAEERAAREKHEAVERAVVKGETPEERIARLERELAKALGK